MDLQIESRHVTMTPRWKQEIEERMSALQSGHDDIIHGRVTLTLHKGHRRAEDTSEALVVVTLPGRHTITARKQDKTFEEAMRAAFFAVDGELATYREKRATKEIRVPPIPFRGVISKIFPDEGYGFILMDGGEEIYFHRNALHGLTFEQLEDGTEVAFDLEEGEKGPQAKTVNPVPIVP